MVNLPGLDFLPWHRNLDLLLGLGEGLLFLEDRFLGLNFDRLLEADVNVDVLYLLDLGGFEYGLRSFWYYNLLLWNWLLKL